MKLKFIQNGELKMTNKQVILCARVAEKLNKDFDDVKKMKLEGIIEALLTKMDNDCIDIDDMFRHII
jgi:hypothetical protein